MQRMDRVRDEVHLEKGDFLVNVKSGSEVIWNT